MFAHGKNLCLENLLWENLSLSNHDVSLERRTLKFITMFSRDPYKLENIEDNLFCRGETISVETYFWKPCRDKIRLEKY
jgi:hypothetical protein